VDAENVIRPAHSAGPDIATSLHKPAVKAITDHQRTGLAMTASTAGKRSRLGAGLPHLGSAHRHRDVCQGRTRLRVRFRTSEAVTAAQRTLAETLLVRPSSGRKLSLSSTRSCGAARTSVTEKRSPVPAGKVVTLHDLADLHFDAVEHSWSPLSDNLRVNIARTLRLTCQNVVLAGQRLVCRICWQPFGTVHARSMHPSHGAGRQAVQGAALPPRPGNAVIIAACSPPRRALAAEQPKHRPVVEQDDLMSICLRPFFPCSAGLW
jgi:hypothetical protein